jgi:hypothetical protein
MQGTWRDMARRSALADSPMLIDHVAFVPENLRPAKPDPV